MHQQHLDKQQLYNTLSNDQGLVDNVKLQLRQKIIHKLKNTQGISKQIEPKKQFIRKVSVSLIHQFLTQERLFHTLAVFAPESGLSKAIFKVQQLRQLLKMKSQSDDLSTLEQLMKLFLPKGRLHQSLVSTSVQTDDKQTIQNLQNKLSHIQFQYKQKAVETLKSVEDSEQRFLKYKNDLNKRYKSELQQELKRIRQFQIASVRLQEQQKSKIKRKQYEEELELAYQSKLEKLREREAEVIARVATKMKQVENYNYQMRQKILRDFESVKAKEEELDRLKDQLLAQQRLNLSK